MLNRYRVIGGVLIAILVLAVAPTVFGAFTPEVFVIDQPSVDNTVNVTRATIDAPGWVVIHADADGAPGPVIGYSPLAAGINANIKVDIDPKAATSVLYAMLHEDNGEAGVFDFPDGADVPVERSGEPVTKSFNVTSQESTVVNVLGGDKRFSTLVSAIDVIGGLSTKDLTRSWNVQGFQESGLAIVLHVVEHFSYHVGQITLHTKLLKDVDTGYYAGQDLQRKG